MNVIQKFKQIRKNRVLKSQLGSKIIRISNIDGLAEAFATAVKRHTTTPGTSRTVAASSAPKQSLIKTIPRTAAEIRSNRMASSHMAEATRIPHEKLLTLNDESLNIISKALNEGKIDPITGNAALPPSYMKILSSDPAWHAIQNESSPLPSQDQLFQTFLKK